MKKNSKILTRRSFIERTSAAVSCLTILPGSVVSGFAQGAAETDASVFLQKGVQYAGPASDELLFARGARRVYSGEALTGISLPIGGVGAGPIQINGEGRRHIWQIFKNYQAISLPDSFFAVRAKVGNTDPVVKLLQTTPEGCFPAMKLLRFSGEYPFGWFRFEDPALPIEVRMEVFSPLIPLNEHDSSIPCAIFNLTARNSGEQPVETAFLATQQNPIGILTGHEVIKDRSAAAYGGNCNRIQRNNSTTKLHMTSDKPKGSPAFGDMVLATVAQDATGVASWESIDTLYRQFIDNGTVSGIEFAGPSPDGQTINGALMVPMTLEPGDERTVSFILTWHFPNVEPVKGHGGNHYSGWWNDAMAVAHEVTDRLDELTRQTRLYNETFYRSNLPWWLLDRISSQVAILSTNSIHWDANGFFWGWEGCNASSGCCSGNATHVWGYAQAHARLFPLIGRTMRMEDGSNLKPDGRLPVRFWHHFPAFDGQCHFIISAFREHLISADSSWIRTIWPKVREAMVYLIARWDAAGTPSITEENTGGFPDGMIAGPQHAMDGDQSGTSSWLGSLYLCALAAAEKMAVVVGDDHSAIYYRKIREVGAINQDKALFNGEYFIQLPDNPPLQDYHTGCYIDQMLGQWWALQIGCGWLYPKDHVRTAMSSLFRYNFHEDFRGIVQRPRKFVDDNDAGMVQCTWPKGGRPGSHMDKEIGYADEVMSGFEYAAAGLMVSCGLLREGFTVLDAASNRYDGRLRTGLTGADNPETNAWGYSGNPFGDDECGKFYVRAMSIWSVLLACQGFEFDASARRIGFTPVWQPEKHTSFFTASEGWGLFRQDRNGHRQSNALEVKWGKLQIITLKLNLSDGNRPEKIIVKAKRRSIPVNCTFDGNQVELNFPRKITLTEGQTLEIFME